jgi:hypothetical protein
MNGKLRPGLRLVRFCIVFEPRCDDRLPAMLGIGAIQRRKQQQFLGKFEWNGDGDS